MTSTYKTKHDRLAINESWSGYDRAITKASPWVHTRGGKRTNTLGSQQSLSTSGTQQEHTSNMWLLYVYRTQWLDFYQFPMVVLGLFWDHSVDPAATRLPKAIHGGSSSASRGHTSPHTSGWQCLRPRALRRGCGEIARLLLGGPPTCVTTSNPHDQQHFSC